MTGGEKKDMQRAHAEYKSLRLYGLMSFVGFNMRHATTTFSSWPSCKAFFSFHQRAKKITNFFHIQEFLAMVSLKKNKKYFLPDLPCWLFFMCWSYMKNFNNGSPLYARNLIFPSQILLASRFSLYLFSSPNNIFIHGNEDIHFVGGRGNFLIKFRNKFNL